MLADGQDGTKADLMGSLINCVFARGRNTH